MCRYCRITLTPYSTVEGAIFREVDDELRFIRVLAWGNWVIYSSFQATRFHTSTMAYLPNFDDLPPVEGMPQGCAWGVFDKNGNKDLLGTLNLLTPEVVKDAAAGVRQGLSISLKSVAFRCETRHG